MSLRLVESQPADDGALDPRDPALFRSGLSSARAALRDGRARQHARAAAGAGGDGDGDGRDAHDGHDGHDGHEGDPDA